MKIGHFFNGKKKAKKKKVTRYKDKLIQMRDGDIESVDQT